jgi:hypothetical protein
MDDSQSAQTDTDAILPVAIGTGVWCALLVILLLGHSTLAENGTTWWIGAAAVGVVSGAGGLVFLRWRKRRALRRAGQE